MYQCALCGNEVHNVRKFWCLKCYKQWKDAILNKEPWTRDLQNLEQRRRYHEKKEQEAFGNLVYLGSEWDISEDGKLVPLAEHFEDN